MGILTHSGTAFISAILQEDEFADIGKLADELREEAREATLDEAGR